MDDESIARACHQDALRFAALLARCGGDNQRAGPFQKHQLFQALQALYFSRSLTPATRFAVRALLLSDGRFGTRRPNDWLIDDRVLQRVGERQFSMNDLYIATMMVAGAHCSHCRRLFAGVDLEYDAMRANARFMTRGRGDEPDDLEIRADWAPPHDCAISRPVNSRR